MLAHAGAGATAALAAAQWPQEEASDCILGVDMPDRHLTSEAHGMMHAW
jgi:hypothetical protein